MLLLCVVCALQVWCSSADLSQWTQLTSAASWWPRWGHTLEYFNDTLVMIGGDDGGDDGESVDPLDAKTNEVWISYNQPGSPLGAAWTWSAEHHIRNTRARTQSRQSVCCTVWCA